jgi:hypothetical protein
VALGEQVAALVGRGGMRAQEAPRAAVESPEGGLSTPEGLAGCLEAIGASGQTPRVVDLATWEGREVAVIVLDDPDAGTGRLGVWVVERSCRPGADGLVHYQSVTG